MSFYDFKNEEEQILISVLPLIDTFFVFVILAQSDRTISIVQNFLKKKKNERKIVFQKILKILNLIEIIPFTLVKGYNFD